MKSVAFSMPTKNATTEKAVAPHQSHVQQRARASGRFVPFSVRREAARDAGGRFVKRLEPAERQEAERLADRERALLARQLARHKGDLQLQRLDADEAAKRGREAIEEYYERIFRHGLQAAGNPGLLLTPRDRALLARLIRDEGDFWAGFMADIAAGKGTMDYDRRLGLYEQAAREVYWAGWALGDFRPARRIRWQTSPAEHCASCVRLHRNGVAYTVREFVRDVLGKGFLPQAGSLDCRTNCKCRLEEVA